ncbi:hypothetical protein NHX12_015516 [Muraenolepis orangiensis]|uniref:Immunoglobulin I-set domain-containing protein n=1 Tax=Muraenolepis orangiensis TaxID=630683 RepID=A0A9Q0I3P3_9TELE|nr:hypothetical protein NHX12_015516 [Muraenolepis orangiensis]
MSRASGPADLQPAPPRFTRKLRQAALGTGCDVRLRVAVSGNPEPTLLWYRDGEPLPPPGEARDRDPGGLWIRDCRTTLSCQRITLHKNLFFSFVLNSGITIIWFTTTFNHDHKQGNPGLLVATIFCFFNGEVQTVLRRHWNQQRMQLGGSFSNAEVFRSASYVASSLTEVHRCYSIESHTEYLNGKNYRDVQTPAHSIHRSETPFA